MELGLTPFHLFTAKPRRLQHLHDPEPSDAIVERSFVLFDATNEIAQFCTESFYLFQQDCVRAMLSGQAVSQTGAENLKTLLLTFAAYTAADEGRVLNLADPTV